MYADFCRLRSRRNVVQFVLSILKTLCKVSNDAGILFQVFVIFCTFYIFLTKNDFFKCFFFEL